MNRLALGVCVGMLFMVSLSLGGCSSEAISKDSRTTFLNATDLQVMTDTMAQKITSDEKIAALTRNGPIVIVLWPIGNDTNEIIPQSQKWLYVHRLRVLLSNKPALKSQFRFVLNRRDYEALQKEEGLTPEQLGVPEERLHPDYALTGTFSTLTSVSGAGKNRDDYYLCTFRMTEIKPGNKAGQLIWEDAYETRKMTKKELLD